MQAGREASAANVHRTAHAMAPPEDINRPRVAGPPRPPSRGPAPRPSVFFPERYRPRDAGIAGRVAPEREPTIDELFSQAEAFRRTAPHPVARRLHRWRRELKEIAADTERLAHLAATRTLRWLSSVTAVSAWRSHGGRAVRTGWSAAQRHGRRARMPLVTSRRRRPHPAFALPLVALAIVWAGGEAWPPHDTRPTAPPVKPADTTRAATEDSWPQAAVTVALDAAKQTVAAADPAVEASTDALPAPVPPRSADAVTDAAVAPPAVDGPYLGTLVIGSRPAGARVSVDGIARGRSPLSIGRLEAGSHVVRVDLPGYRRWGWAVQVVANQRTRVNVQLVPAAGAAGEASP